ncbi:NAD(P)/FAD-dependent oxidoreductase [Thioalkalivibrio sp. HK1]|uniref:NAD(P)/FAD-dependent oxidoreductase n=1 Tax=Thioalkalivibrio sp. HK1 TaxID=1469245 RepID=UPI0004726B74|nr:FAD-binding oxidoreductase [Thioalkalivibrio sp. HK1]
MEKSSSATSTTTHKATPGSDWPDSWYAATIPDPPPTPVLAGSHSADVCVVGGGYTGLSAAMYLAERGYSVILLEAHRCGWGASGRNGGQIGSGLRGSADALEATLGVERARILWNLCEEAKSLIAERIARHGIECEYRPGNLLACIRSRHIPAIEREAEFCLKRYGYEGFRMFDRQAMRAEVASDEYAGGRMDAGGGHLHPLRYALGMARAASKLGVRIFEHSKVESIRWSQPASLRTMSGEVSARYVILAGNAYLGGIEPRIESRIMPITSYMLATESLGESRARSLIPSGACVHSTRFVVDYYRLSHDHRLLFGGGETWSRRPLSTPKDFVRRYLSRVFPQLAKVGIDYAWSGQLAITMSRLPHVGRLPPNGFFAQGFSGHGVALSQIAGVLIAEALCGTAERFDVLASLRHRPFPGGTRLRHPLLVLGMLFYALRDRI